MRSLIVALFLVVGCTTKQEEKKNDTIKVDTTYQKKIDTVSDLQDDVIENSPSQIESEEYIQLERGDTIVLEPIK